MKARSAQSTIFTATVSHAEEDEPNFSRDFRSRQELPSSNFNDAGNYSPPLSGSANKSPDQEVLNLSDHIEEIRKISGEAFDRAKPGSDRLPILRRLQELLDESEAATEIAFGYTEEDDAQITIDPVADEIERIELRSKLGIAA